MARPDSAYDLLKSVLTDWGLTSLFNYAKQYLTDGLTSDEVQLKLQETKEYKTRFAGNELRKAKGLSTLSPAQYIAVEEQYRNVLQSFGLPSNFYDQHEDFTKLIGNDLSPTEVQSRAQVARDQYIAAPESMKNLWREYFGTQGDALAAILDPTVATSLIQERGGQVALGGAAAEQGLHIGQSRAQTFQQRGVTLEGARKAYQQIASALPTDQGIASRFGSTLDQEDEEDALLLGDADAFNKRETLHGNEKALFAGSGGLDQNAISVSQSY